MEKSEESEILVYQDDMVFDSPRELPIDFNERSFKNYICESDEFKSLGIKSISHSKVMYAFKKLDDTEENDGNYENLIFKAIYENKYRPISKETDLGVKPTNQQKTFYWEAAPLLSSIVMAYARNSRLKGEALAESALFELGYNTADALSNSTLTDDYILQLLLNNSIVQSNMVLQFESQLKDRLEQIWNFAHSCPPDQLVQVMGTVLKTLDNSIFDLCNASSYSNPKGGQADRSTTYRKSLNSVFEELMAERDKMRCSPSGQAVEAGRTYSMRFDLTKAPSSPENAKIIKTLKDCFVYRRDNDDSSEKKEFENAYKKYLLAVTDNTVRQPNAIKFSSNFRQIHDYVSSHISRKTILAAYDTELSTLLANIYNRAYSTSYPFDFLLSNYNDSNINTQQENIIQHIKKILISEFFPYISLIMDANNLAITAYNQSNNSNFFEADKIAILDGFNRNNRGTAAGKFDELVHAHLHLLAQYSNLPLLSDSRPTTVNKFFKSYNKNCSPLLGPLSLSASELVYMSKLLNDVDDFVTNNTSALAAAATGFLYECMLAMVYKKGVLRKHLVGFLKYRS